MALPPAGARSARPLLGERAGVRADRAVRPPCAFAAKSHGPFPRVPRKLCDEVLRRRYSSADATSSPTSSRTSSPQRAEAAAMVLFPAGARCARPLLGERGRGEGESRRPSAWDFGRENSPIVPRGSEKVLRRSFATKLCDEDLPRMRGSSTSQLRRELRRSDAPNLRPWRSSGRSELRAPSPGGAGQG